MQVLLAQAASRHVDLGPIFLRLGVLIAIVLLAGLVMYLVRKRLLGQHEESSFDASVTEDIRRMRDHGEISEEEYDYMRKAMAARAAGREPPPRPAHMDGGSELRAKPGFDLAGDPLPPEVMDAIRRRNAGDSSD